MSYYFVSLNGLGNCEENHYDFLYVPCIMTAEQLKSFRDSLKVLNNKKNKKAYHNLELMDCSCGAHGCLVSIRTDDLEKNMKISPITEDEIGVLDKFVNVELAEDCEWYELILNQIS